MNETDYNARLYEKMKADWQEDGVKVSKGAKSLSILEPVEYAKANHAMYKNSPSHFRDATGLKQQGCFTFYAFLNNFFCKPFH